MLIDNPDFLTTKLEAGDTAVVPLVVLKELDGLKKSARNSTSQQARSAVRHLCKIVGIEENTPVEKIPFARQGRKCTLEKGVVFIGSTTAEVEALAHISGPMAQERTNDVQVLAEWDWYHREYGDHTIVLTKDLNMSLRGASRGIAVELFSDKDREFHMPTGVVEYETERYKDIEDLFNGIDIVANVDDFSSKPHRNSGVLVSCGTSKALGVFSVRTDGEAYIRPVEWGAPFMSNNARGVRQSIAAHFMLGGIAPGAKNPNGEFLGSLSGRAGSGKTFLAVGCGLEAVKRGYYKNVRVFRPTIAPSKHSDLGFLPGGIDEKMLPWTTAIQDVLDHLGTEILVCQDDAKGGRNRVEAVEKLVTVESINHVRGRGFHDSFIIIDEAQNLEPHELVTLLTRIGEGSSVVMTWDPVQIDNPMVSSGIAEGPYSVLKDRLDSEMVFHVELDRCERGGVSALFN